MGHLLSLPQGNAVIPSVTVRKMGSLIVPVTVSFPSLTAILVGFLPETDFILATTYICLSPLTPKVTSPFFLCWILPQNMILRISGNLVPNEIFPSWSSRQQVLLDSAMMQCRIISTVVRTTFSSLLTWMWKRGMACFSAVHCRFESYECQFRDYCFGSVFSSRIKTSQSFSLITSPFR